MCAQTVVYDKHEWTNRVLYSSLSRKTFKLHLTVKQLNLGLLPKNGRQNSVVFEARTTISSSVLEQISYSIEIGARDRSKG